MEDSKVRSLIDHRLKVTRVSRPAGTISSSDAPKPRLLDQVRQAIRARHYSYRTEKAYVGWMKRFIFFHNKRHPAEMGEAEIAQFLSSLARDARVSASTQNQALNAILFLYREVLGKDIGYINGVVRARRPNPLPVVLTRQEVKSLLSVLDGTAWLMATLLYGAGLRVMECMRLRVKDVVSFVFAGGGLQKIQIWAYEGQSVNAAIDSWYRVRQYLSRLYGAVEIPGLKAAADASRGDFAAAVSSALEGQPRSGVVRMQMAPVTMPQGVSVFSSLFRHPQHGYFVFLYYQEP